jgi:PBP1b-binding outer membrane lipoprotein LpoB
MEKIQKFLPITTFVLVLFIFLKGCGTGTQVKSTEKKVDVLTTKVDSLSNIVVTQQEMIQVLENTTMWQTLIIEELSDKDHMPINHYRSEDRK